VSIRAGRLISQGYRRGSMGRSDSGTCARRQFSKGSSRRSSAHSRTRRAAVRGSEHPPVGRTCRIGGIGGCPCPTGSSPGLTAPTRNESLGAQRLERYGALEPLDCACYVAPRVSPGTVDRGRRSTPVLGGGGPLTSRSRCRAQGSFSNISPHAAVSRRAGTFDVVVFSDVLSVLAEPGLRLLVAIPTR